MTYFTGNKQFNVLILSCGRRVELVNAFKSARDRLGVKGSIIGADMSSTAPALCFTDKKYKLPAVSAEGYTSRLKEIVAKEKISLIVPTIDTELSLIAELKQEFKELGVETLIPSKEIVEICNDKVKSVEFFTSHGFKVPKTYDRVQAAEYDGDYPLFIKPRNGSSSVNAFKINSKKELLFFLDYVDNPIIQEYALGQEYTVDVMTDFEGNPLLIVPRKRLVVRGGEIIKGQVEKNHVIISEMRRLIKELNFVGQLTVQGFLTKQDDFILIEMNARFGGGAPMSIKAGADFCGCLYKMLDGQPVVFSDAYRDGTIIARFDDCVEISDD